jgi:hypothetical protein
MLHLIGQVLAGVRSEDRRADREITDCTQSSEPSAVKFTLGGGGYGRLP